MEWFNRLPAKTPVESLEQRVCRAIQETDELPVFRASAAYRQTNGHDAYGIPCPICGRTIRVPIAPAPSEPMAFERIGPDDALTLAPAIQCVCGHRFVIAEGEYAAV